MNVWLLIEFAGFFVAGGCVALLAIGLLVRQLMRGSLGS